jgi:hypothetical protein
MMSSELKPTPLRTIDREQLRRDFAATAARQAELTHQGQKLLARIRPSSKYYGQGQEDALFAVCIGPSGEYSVLGGPGGQYRLKAHVATELDRTAPLPTLSRKPPL